MGMFDSSKKIKEKEAELAKLQTEVDTLKQQGTVQNEHIRRWQESYETLGDEKSTLVLHLRAARESEEDTKKKAEELVVEVTTRDERIKSLTRLVSRFTHEQVRSSLSAAHGGKESSGDEQLGNMMEIIEAQSSEITRLESEIRGRERSILVAESSATESFSLVGKRNGEMKQMSRKIEEYERLLAEKSTELEHCQSTAFQACQKERASWEKYVEQLKNWHEYEKRQVKEALEKKLLPLEQRVANAEHNTQAVQESAEYERASMAAKHQSELQDLRSHHIEELRQATEDSIAELVQQLEVSNSQLSNSEEALRKKTEELDELTEINDQTKLRLNQTRVQLDGETRKARLASQDKQALDQQYEFMQQQCAVLQEKLTAASQKSGTAVQNANTSTNVLYLPRIFR